MVDNTVSALSLSRPTSAEEHPVAEVLGRLLVMRLSRLLVAVHGGDGRRAAQADAQATAVAQEAVVSHPLLLVSAGLFPRVLVAAQGKGGEVEFQAHDGGL